MYINSSFFVAKETANFETAHVYIFSTVVGTYSATGKVAFAFDYIVLYIEQICNLTGIILRNDDLSFALYMSTTVVYACVSFSRKRSD